MPVSKEDALEFLKDDIAGERAKIVADTLIEGGIHGLADVIATFVSPTPSMRKAREAGLLDTAEALSFTATVFVFGVVFGAGLESGEIPCGQE